MPKKQSSCDMLTKEGYQLLEFILNKLKQKNPVKREQELRFDLELMLYLLSRYRIECLLNTLSDIDKYVEEFK